MSNLHVITRPELREIIHCAQTRISPDRFEASIAEGTQRIWFRTVNENGVKGVMHYQLAFPSGESTPSSVLAFWTKNTSHPEKYFVADTETFGVEPFHLDRVFRKRD